MTSALFDSVARIARHEAGARSVAGVGRVTDVFAGSGDDHAVTVEMRDTGLVLPRVPVAVGVMGFAAIPAADDLVVVTFLDGDVNAPVVVGRLYHPDQPPPPHEEGEIVLHVPSGDPKIELDVAPKTPSIKLVVGDVEVEILDDSLTATVGDVKIKAASSGGRLDIEVGQASIVMKKNGDLTLETTGNLTLKGSKVAIKAMGVLELSGAQVKIG